MVKDKQQLERLKELIKAIRVAKVRIRRKAKVASKMLQKAGRSLLQQLPQHLIFLKSWPFSLSVISVSVRLLSASATQSPISSISRRLISVKAG